MSTSTKPGLKAGYLPAGLGQDGIRLYAELSKGYDFSECEHLLFEMCVAQDRLAQLRGLLAKEKDPNIIVRLTGAEAKVSGSFMRLWKSAGLSAPDAPPTKGRR